MFVISFGFRDTTNKGSFGPEAQRVIDNHNIESQRQEFEAMFNGLECKDVAHQPFQNEVQVFLDEDNQRFNLTKTCCESFKDRIKNMLGRS